ncbi:MAG: hypothetical protein ACM3VT_04525 [Solirubrobacterales bacterium]
MRGKSRVLGRCVAAVVLAAVWVDAGLGAQPIVRKPLPEAIVLNAVDGKLLHVDANDTWWFELTSEVKGRTYQSPVGTRFMLLPSSVLQQLISDVNDRATPAYRLSAQVTRYHGDNFLLATYFLPLSKFKDAGSGAASQQAVDGGQKVGEAAVDVPTDPDLAIPAEILEKLKNRRPVHGPLQKPSETRATDKPDVYLGRTLANRVGLIEAGIDRMHGVDASGLQPPAYGLFVPYALGWSVSDERYELLPCTALEKARQLQESSIETIRFNVAGLVTQFKGKQYLLLQRAAPVYNYGNFGR